MSFDGPARDVVAWLKTPDGELWSRRRIGQRMARHDDDSGVFADVIPDIHGGGGARSACWPVPYAIWDIDNPGWR
jgi:hypothetical protein